MLAKIKNQKEMEVLVAIVSVFLIGYFLWPRSKKRENHGSINTYDVAIIGSGLAGSVSALGLSKTLKVVVLERERHPRHKLGESTVPTTTGLMDLFAKTYGIDELVNLFRYPYLKKLGIRAWPKTHFWFGLHKEGKKLESEDEKLFETFLAPIGPDVHVVRADLDRYLASLYPKYGISYIDQCPVSEFSRDDGVWTIQTREGSLKAKYLIDASGNGFVGKRFNKWVEPDEKPMETNSRTIYGFFSYSGSVDLDFLGPCPGFIHKRHAGTIHHCFKGGWMWVIPFDSNEVSIGLNLDRRVYPSIDERPEIEFWKIVSRFPSMKEHLDRMQLKGKFFSHGRLQKASSSIFGDGFALTPHAASFVDPLYSTGIAQSLLFILRLIPCITKNGKLDIQEEKLEAMNKLFQIELAHADRLVAASYHTFHDNDKYDLVFQQWCAFSYIQFKFAYANPFNSNVPHLLGANPVRVAELKRLLEAIKKGEEINQLRKDFSAIPAPMVRNRYNGTTVFSASHFEGAKSHSFTGIEEACQGLGLMKGMKTPFFEELVKSRSTDLFENFKGSRLDELRDNIEGFGYNI